MTAELLAAFTLGLLSAPHCAAMCGGIATALMVGARRSETARDEGLIASTSTSASVSQPCAPTWHTSAGQPMWITALRFGTGKMLGYALLGIIAGTSGYLLGSTHASVMTALRVMAGLLLIGLGLYTAGWWTGLRRLESAAYRFWQPLLGRLRTLELGKSGNQLLTGALWGLLPCGIVYSVLGLAMASATVWHGALIMLAFGLGTLPFVLGAGGILGISLPLLHRDWVRKAAGLVFIGIGTISILMVTGLLHRAH